MPKKKWTAGKVALGAAGCVVVGLGASCAVAMVIAVALTPDRTDQPASRAAPEALPEPEPFDLEVDAEREREYAERFSIPGCDGLEELYRMELLARPEGPGLAFLRGVIVSSDSSGRRPALLVDLDGDDGDVAWVEPPAECTGAGVETGVEVVVAGGWMGQRVRIVDGQRRVYPKVTAYTIVTAAWWDEKRAEWLDWAHEDEIPRRRTSDR